MNLIRDFKNIIYPLLLMFLLFGAVFFTKSVPFFLLFILFVWFFLFKDFDDKTFIRFIVSPFIIYVIIITIGFIFSNNKIESVKVLERNTPFLILPIIIYCKKWNLKEIDYFSKFLVNTTLIIAFLSVVKLVYFYLTHQDFVKSMDSTYLQWKLPHLMGFHPTYFGFIIVSVVLILLSDVLNKKNNNIYNLFKALCLTFYLFYLSPRVSVFCIVIVWTLVSYFFLKKNVKLKLKHIILISSIVLIFVLFLTNYEYLTHKVIKSISDKRFILWKFAIDIIKDNYFIFGEGLDGSRIIIEEYIENNKLTQFEVSDLHNQFLMSYADLGVFGLISLIYIIINPVFWTKNKPLILFLFIFLISILTESMLYVIKGIIIFNIIQSIFVMRTKEFKLNNTIS